MMIELYLLILAIANLITEQQIVRGPLNRLFDPATNYLKWNRIYRFVWDIFSCGACASFWIGLIQSLIIGLTLPESIKIGLIAMFIYAVIEKLKR